MMSMSNKMAIKISCDNITKRVREIPETFEALRNTIKAQMCKGNGSVAKSIKADRFAVTYEDDTGDTINLSDDEDLLAAYDVAENHISNKQLKLKILPREGEETQTFSEPKIVEIQEPMM